MTTIWTAPSCQKIRPFMHAPSPPPNGFSLAGAKNEFVSFHIAVDGPAAAVSMVANLPGFDVRLYREALINVPTPTGGDGAAGWWPDALIPDVDPLVNEKRNAFPFAVPAGETRAVLVDILIPQGKAAGAYTGSVDVTVDGAKTSVPVSVTAWDFAIPSTATLKSAFGMFWNAQGLLTGNAQDNAARARLVQLGLDNRISISALGGSTTPHKDWPNFDQVFGPYLEGSAPTRLKGAKLTAAQIFGDLTDTALLQSYAAHFKLKSWWQWFAYVEDEPAANATKWANVKARVAALKANAPGVSRLLTASMQMLKGNLADPLGDITLCCPTIDQMEDKPGRPLAGDNRDLYPADCWWYQACDSWGCGYPSDESGWPSYAIDTDGTRNRAMEWLSFAYGLTGELYWETVLAWTSLGGGDAWNSQQWQGGAGDGTLFYPGTVAKIGGKTPIPIESLRLKGIRDGMQDFELLTLAARAGKAAETHALARSLFPVTYQGSTSPAKIEAARAQLAAWIAPPAVVIPPPAPPAPPSTAVAKAALDKVSAMLDAAKTFIADTIAALK